MTLAGENCVQQSSRMYLASGGRRVFRENAHVDYYGAHPRSLPRQARTKTSASNRVGSEVLTSKLDKRRLPNRRANARGVEVGVSGREEMPLFERRRGASFDKNSLFVRQFRYKPRTRPPSAVSGNTSQKAKRKLKKNPAVAVGCSSSSSSSSSESSCSSDEDIGAPTGAAKTSARMTTEAPAGAAKSPARMETEAPAGAPKTPARVKPARTRAPSGPKLRPLENSAVPAPSTSMLTSSSSVSQSDVGRKNPAEMENTVFVCQGKGCCKRGGDEVMEVVSAQGVREGFEVVGCKCMGRCKFGPVVVAKFEAGEEGVEFTSVDPTTVGKLLSENYKKAEPSL
ncbi:hypothetical protein BSKO_09057 [Bryopsis sp. KO-2023]|nr:hypothetical protein BSKO_09057 [Bryopsis sp. KO-2023]